MSLVRFDRTLSDVLKLMNDLPSNPNYIIETYHPPIQNLKAASSRNGHLLYQSAHDIHLSRLEMNLPFLYKVLRIFILGNQNSEV